MSVMNFGSIWKCNQLLSATHPYSARRFQTKAQSYPWCQFRIEISQLKSNRKINTWYWHLWVGPAQCFCPLSSHFCWALHNYGVFFNYLPTVCFAHIFWLQSIRVYLFNLLPLAFCLSLACPWGVTRVFFIYSFSVFCRYFSVVWCKKGALFVYFIVYVFMLLAV